MSAAEVTDAAPVPCQVELCFVAQLVPTRMPLSVTSAEDRCALCIGEVYVQMDRERVTMMVKVV